LIVVLSPAQMEVGPPACIVACALACCIDNSITIKTEKAATPLTTAAVENFCLFTECKVVPINFVFCPCYMSLSILELRMLFKIHFVISGWIT
jgi:hypothetical protein